MEKLKVHALMAIVAIAMDLAGAELLLYVMLRAIHATPRLIVVLVRVTAEVTYVVGQIQCAFPECVQSVLQEKVTVTPRQSVPILAHANRMVHV